MQNCPKCGCPNPTGRTACFRCDSALQAQVPAAYPPKKRRTVPIWPGLTLCLVVAILFAYVSVVPGMCYLGRWRSVRSGDAPEASYLIIERSVLTGGYRLKMMNEEETESIRGEGRLVRGVLEAHVVVPKTEYSPRLTMHVKIRRLTLSDGISVTLDTVEGYPYLGDIGRTTVIYRRL